MEEIDFGPQTALFMPSKSGSHLIIFLFLFHTEPQHYYFVMEI